MRDERGHTLVEIAARDVTLWNNVAFRRPAGLPSLLGVSAPGTDAQTAWAQCQAVRPTASDPESGCSG